MTDSKTSENSSVAAASAAVNTASENVATSKKSTKQKTESTASRSSLSFLKVLFGLVVLLAISGLGFLYWEQGKVIDTLFTEYNAASQQGEILNARFEVGDQARAALQEELVQIKADREELRAQVVEQAQQVADLNRDLVSTRMSLSEQSGGTNQAWLLAEAESLLRLAQQRLLNARDVNTVISLYLSSDDLLSQLNDPAVHAVREVLATELDTLRGVRLPDIQSFYTRLGEVSILLDTLSLAAELSGGELTFVKPEASPLSEDAGWMEELGSTLSQYFVLSRKDSEVRPQLTPEQAFMIKQLVKLHIEEARLALLRGEVRVFQAALDQAVSDIAAYLEGANKQTVQATLEQIRNSSIVAIIPPVGSTLNALRQIAPVSAMSEGN